MKTLFVVIFGFLLWAVMYFAICMFLTMIGGHGVTYYLEIPELFAAWFVIGGLLCSCVSEEVAKDLFSKT